MTISQDFDLKAELKKCKTDDDLTGKNGLLQNVMDEHLGYEKHSSIGGHSRNSRNGKAKKTLKSHYGNVKLEIPKNCHLFIPMQQSKGHF